MFKKQFKIASEQVIAAKDRKKIRQDMQKQFDQESVEKLFIYADTITCQKLEKSKMIIYRDETDPLIVDSTSNKDYFPTVYCLMLFPDFLKIVFEIKPEVEKSLKTGAQLMWSGIANFDSLPDFDGDEVVAIKTPDGKILAVGAIACSKKSLEAGEKTEGVAAYILHVVGDTLYEAGSKNEKAAVFKKMTAAELKEKEESDAKAKTNQKKDENEDNEDILAFYNQINKNKTTGGVKTANLKKAIIKAPAKAKGNARDDRSDDESHKQKGKKKNVDKKGTAKDGEEEEAHAETDAKVDSKVSTKEMDDLLMEAFLNCLVISLTEGDLPIDNATLWTNHILPHRNPEKTIDIKNTSYKKLSKFIAHADKLGIITYKESTKKSATAAITHINRKNHMLSNWEPTVSSAMTKEDEEKSGKKEQKLAITHEVVNMCKPDILLKKYLNLAPDTEFITHDEMEKKIKDFLKKANLLQKDQVIVNEMLQEDFNIEDDDSDEEEDDKKSDDQGSDNEVKDSKAQNALVEEKKKKKGVKGPILTIKLSKFMAMLTKHLTYIYKITDLKTKKEIIKQGKFEGVSIFAEKAHNKFITRVTALDVFGVSLEGLLADWQAKFSTTGAIHEVLISKHHVKEISLQGIFLDEVKDYLVQVIKIPENLIVTVNKVDKKKKKNTRQM